MYNVPSPRGCVGVRIGTIPALIVEGDYQGQQEIKNQGTHMTNPLHIKLKRTDNTNSTKNREWSLGHISANSWLMWSAKKRVSWQVWTTFSYIGYMYIGTTLMICLNDMKDINETWYASCIYRLINILSDTVTQLNYPRSELLGTVLTLFVIPLQNYGMNCQNIFEMKQILINFQN
jgi:ABC-type uncharacterized transport system permease subunit